MEDLGEGLGIILNFSCRVSAGIMGHVSVM